MNIVKVNIPPTWVPLIEDLSSETLHPLIHGLFLTLPKNKNSWTKIDRLNWLVLANNIFNVIYKKDSLENADIEIKLSMLE